MANKNRANLTSYGIVQLFDIDTEYENWRFRMELLMKYFDLYRYIQYDYSAHMPPVEGQPRMKHDEDLAARHLIVRHISDTLLKTFKEKYGNKAGDQSTYQIWHYFQSLYEKKPGLAAKRRKSGH